MATMIGEFTKRAYTLLALAQEEARRHHHYYIGTEHLLLGLLREGDGLAPKVLENLGVNLQNLQQAIEVVSQRKLALPQRARLYMPTIPKLARLFVRKDTLRLTRRAQKVVALANEEAQRLNHHYIGTEHLLLGMVREGKGLAGQLLASERVSLSKVRAEIIRILGQTDYEKRARSSRRFFVSLLAVSIGIALVALWRKMIQHQG